MNHIISWLVWIVFISSILDEFESFHFVGSERSAKNFHFEPIIERLSTHIYWDQMKDPFKTYSIQLQKKKRVNNVWKNAIAGGGVSGVLWQKE